MIRAFRASSRVALALAALCLACQGEITGTAAVSGGGMPALPGPGPSPSVTPPSCEAPAPGPSPLRRLTHREYDNTVRDLLGDDGRLGAQFSREETFLGFDNNATARGTTPLLAEQYLHAAETLAARAVQQLPTLTGCDPNDAAGRDGCAKSFIARFGARAFRRPLAATDQARFEGLYTSASSAWGFGKAIELVLQAMLQSPHFLYRVELGSGAPQSGVLPLGPWQLAARLSYLLWGSMPDQALSDAASRGELVTREQVAAQAQRLSDDARSRYVLGDFHRQWLSLDLIEGFETSLDGFSDELRPLLQQETTELVSAVLWQGDGTLTSLLTAPYSFMNAKLAAFYGLSGPTGDAFERVPLEPARGLGILTQGGILAAHSHAAKTSPVLRGKFVREQLLCNPPPPPPPGVDFTVAEKDQSLTVREQSVIHRADPSCAACHRFMDPIGLGFEAFDALGRFRASDGGRPVDSSGELLESDVNGAFNGPAELAHKLAASPQVAQCFARQWFRYAYGRDESAADACSVSSLERAMAESGGRISELVLALTRTDAFLFRSVPAGESP
jgi:hypothetical protein